ncbi:sirohydrochlorin chelatase [Kitasatospora sp. NPDC056446]|uniref:sirohydrochlorin chelatase n=1 Tax=Kitasatospora sp. NPDC056446 TaxID=3345819 RepID=UPI0036914C80
MAPVLLAVAHGSRDPAAVTSVRALLRLVRRLRPGLTVRCCFLDLARPSLADALPGLADRRPVLVPLVLGTGYHLRVDLPAALAAAGLPPAHLAPALGPHPLLAARLGRPVTPAHLSAAAPTPQQAVAGLRRAGHPEVALAAYLLSPGFFARRAAAAQATWTTAPLGAHPAVARLVLRRYDEARAASAPPVAA